MKTGKIYTITVFKRILSKNFSKSTTFVGLKCIWNVIRVNASCLNQPLSKMGTVAFKATKPVSSPEPLKKLKKKKIPKAVEWQTAQFLSAQEDEAIGYP